MNDDPRQTGLAAWCAFLTNLSPATLDDIDGLISDDVRFSDPFNDVRGRAAVRAVFTHMLDQCQDLRFTITARALDGTTGLLRWRFQARVAWIGQLDFLGMSDVQMTPAGQVALHADYWDSGGPILARLPVLGAPIRFIRRRLAVDVGKTS